VIPIAAPVDHSHSIAAAVGALSKIEKDLKIHIRIIGMRF
jgi:hypothetical protein